MKDKEPKDVDLSNAEDILREAQMGAGAKATTQDGKTTALELVKEQTTAIKPLIYNEVGGFMLARMLQKQKKLHIILWLISNGFEHGLHQIKESLDAQKFSYKGKEYIIDRNKIQNRLGEHVYNHEINEAVRGLSFIRDSGYTVDAKNFADAVKREHFTALWGKWKLPFIALCIAMGVALVMGIVALLGFTSQKDALADLDKANICLNDIPCMQGKIATIQAQIAEQQQREQPPTPNPPPNPNQ